MKRTANLLFLFFAALWGIRSVKAQWVQTNGPYGGTIYALKTYPSGNGGTNIMAGTSSGAFISTDNGTNWTQVNIVNNMFQPPVSFLATAPDSSGGTYIYAGLGAFGFGGYGIYLSDDNGSTWTDIGLDYAGPQALAVETTGPGSLRLIAGTSQGVYTSTDNGANWAPVNNGLTDKDIKALAVASDGSGTTHWFAGTFGGMFVSTDNGASWDTANTGIINQGYTKPPISAIGVIPNGSGGAIILAGTQYGGIFLSTNYGSNWTADTNSPSFATSFTMAKDRSGNTTVFVGSVGSGVYRSDDGGSSWTQFNNGLNGFYATYINSMAVTGNGTNNVRIFSGTSNGLYLSDNNGSNWTESDTGITGISINALTTATDGSGVTTIFAGGAGLYRSTDNGESWDEVDNDDITSLAVSPDSNGGNYIYAGTNGNGAIRSDDNGKSWIPINSGITDQDVTCIAAMDSLLIAGTDHDGVFLSDDNGNNWIQMNNGLPSESLSKVNSKVKTSPANLVWPKLIGVTELDRKNPVVMSMLKYTYLTFIMSPTPHTFGKGRGLLNKNIGDYNSNSLVSYSTRHSSINDTSWTEISYGLPEYDGNSFTTLSDSIFFVGTNSNGIYRLIGNDTTWTAVDNGLTNLNNEEITALTTYGNSATFASTLDGVFLSTDNGENWKSVNTGFPDNLNIQSLAISYSNSTNGNELFASTMSSGVWKRPISDMITTGIQKTQKIAPTNFKLEQNYPNPFNPTTVIRYQLAVNSHVSINVYDILGKEVAKLISGIKPAGNYSVRFNGNNLSTGVYFYSITAVPVDGKTASYHQVRKMILLK